MTKQSRLLLTIIYVGSMIATVVLAFLLPENLSSLVLVSLVIQIIAYFLYTLSYVPFGLKLLKKFCSCLLSGEWYYLNNVLFFWLIIFSNLWKNSYGIIDKIIYVWGCFWIAKGHRSRNHRLRANCVCWTVGSNLCKILEQGKCKDPGSTGIACNPFNRIPLILLEGSKWPRPFQQLQLNKPEAKSHFDIEPFSLLH